LGQAAAEVIEKKEMCKFYRQVARILVNQDYRQERENISCSKPLKIENSK
jgi:hypothetical protein